MGVEELRQRVEEALRPFVQAGAPAALVGFPSHRNPGDNAIWRGEMQVLERLGGRLAYVCDPKTYQPELLTRAVRGGTIFLTGGGNFGDLYLEEQELRERVLADFPDNPVVQLPQSAYFASPGRLAQAQQAMSHDRLVLFLRDRFSYQRASEVFSVPTFLCPDIALGVRPVSRVGLPDVDILCLGRQDNESTGRIQEISGPGVHHTDWCLSRPQVLAWKGSRVLPKAAARTRHHRLQEVLERPVAAAFDALSRQAVTSGSRQLSRGRVVITDRLHGHILSLLLGIPHVVMDNDHGKVGDFYRTWTYGNPLARWAAEPDEALELARSMLAQGSARRGA